MSIQSPTHENEELGEEPLLEDPLDTKEKCRLCLKADDVLIPVQTGENSVEAVSAVALKIDILTTVKVAPSDKICTACRLKVKRFYSFRIMCLRSDARIRDERLRKGVTISRAEPAESVRSYKRVKRDFSEMQRSSVSDALSITPVTKYANGSSSFIESKLGPGLTISAVPIKQEADTNENGSNWEHEVDTLVDNGDNMKSEYDDGNGEDCNESPGDETENLEVQIDPFMLMGDDTSEPDLHAHANSAVNVRGHILYPVLGDNTQLPPLQPGPHRRGPLAGKNSRDRERALELIKQMTAVRTKTAAAASSLDGSFLDKPFKCDVCPESFSYYKSFIKHKQRHTGELQPLKCEFCPDVFQTSRQLQNHLKHHNIEKAFPCDQCERSFPTKERLSSHYTLHTGNKPYECEICNKSFAYKSSYGLHIRKQHGEQPLKSQSFKCDKCNLEFDIFVDFKRHLSTHQGEKPFTCNVCEKAFASKSILNVHSRIHNGTKPYRCDICGQAFTQKQSLDYHMRRHNVENPFKCDVCGISFQRRYFLEKHKENHHGGSSSGQQDDVILMGHDEEIDNRRQMDEEDDADSDPLKLEIDESSENHEEPDNFSMKAGLELAQ
ncbi:zinc finger protein 133 [Frankliniella occidentalis]|uniref:Zinc finger protein 133 n=1 Tax=Frankliniella occidentalis TaxID=133901 RepID=A0A6J1TH08_FRAOC|nr:zinc finger protein 133 [Frankliniella occidentalis]